MRQVGSRGEPTGIAVDSAGSVYLAGNFRRILRSDDSLIQQPQQGAALTNGFVARLSATGQWRWATPITEMAYEGMGPLTLDAAGQPVVFGGTYGGSQFGDGTVIPVGTGPGFLGRLTTSGQWLSVLLFGDGAWINPRALATDSAGRFYFGGEYAGTPTFGTHTLPGTGGSVTTPSFFVASFDPAPNAWRWATGGATGGGNLHNMLRTLAVAPAGDRGYVGGQVGGTGARFGSFSVPAVPRVSRWVYRPARRRGQLAVAPRLRGCPPNGHRGRFGRRNRG